MAHSAPKESGARLTQLKMAKPKLAKPYCER